MAGQWWEEDKVEGSGDFWAADKVIDPASDAADPTVEQEVVTSARAFRGAGAGRGSINDPRRLDTPNGRRNVDTENELNRLEKINSGVERDELRKLAEFNVSQPKPPVKSPDRVEQYRKKGYEEKDAVVNAAFDQNVESRLNKPFQEREVDPITGDRISRAYNPNTEAERVAAEEKEGALIRRDARQRAYAEGLPGAVRGLAKGAGQAIGLAQGTVGLVGDLTGNEDLKQWGLEGYRDNMRQAGNLGVAKQFTEIKSADDAMGWAAENAGYVAFQAAQSILAGGMGGVIGNTIGKEALGTAVGLGLSNVMQTFGSVYGEAVDEAKKTGEPVDMRKVLIGATISSAIDTMADKIGLDAITAKGFKGNALSRAVKSVSMQAGVQGGTEAAQLVPEEFGAGRDPFRKGMADQYINEAAVGALGGAGPGVAGAINRNANDAAAQALSSALDGGRAPMVDLAGYLEANAQAPQSINTPAGPVQVPQVDEKTVTIAARDEAMAAIGTAPTVDDAIAAANATVQLTGRAVQLDNDRLLSEALTNAGIADALAPVAEQAAEPVAPTVQAVETPAAPSASASTPAPVVWTGRRGDGYATPEDATRALGERQRLRPAYDWTMKQNAEGRFVLNGEPKGQITPAAGDKPSGNTQGASVLQNAPQSLSSQLADAGYAQPKETVRDLRDQADKVQRLQAAIARSGDDASTIELYRGGRDSQDELGVGRRGAGGAAVVARAVEEVGRAAQVAFGWKPIAITGLRNAFGVQYAGQVFINVEQVAEGDSKGNTPELIAIQTIGHETTHALEKSKDPQDQADYARLREAVLANVKPGVVDSRVASEKEGQDYGEKEVVADISVSFWSDPSFWSRLYDLDDGSTMRRIAYKFMENTAKFVRAVKGSRFDNERFINNVEQVREVAAQVWASKAKRGDSLFGDATTKDQAPSLKKADNSRPGISAEVAPDPRDAKAKDRWGALTPVDKLGITKEVMDALAAKVFDNMGLEGWSVEYTSGMFEGGINPSAILRAPDGTSTEALSEAMRVFGYLLDQKGMVAFDESNTTSESQAGFIKVVLPEGLSTDRIDAIRAEIAARVPQAEGDTVRDGAIVYGNFSQWSDAPLTDEQFRDAIRGVVDAMPEQLGVSPVQRFHSEYAQAYDGEEYDPKGRENYLEGTRYASVQLQDEAGRDNVRGRSRGALSRPWLEGLARSTDAKIARLVGDRQPRRDYSAAAVQDDRPQQPAGRPGTAGDFAEQRGAPSPVARQGADAGRRDGVGGEVRGAVHYGKNGGLKVLSGAMSGSGIRGAEQDRLAAAADPRIKKRVYFYLPVAGGIAKPEIGLGAHVYTADLTGLYDLSAQTMRLPADSNAMESAILDAGYRGYINREQGTAVVLNDSVPVKYEGTSDKFTKVDRAPTVQKPKTVTRTEGDMLVRKPEASEVMEIVKARQAGLELAAPSFKMQYGEARVLASEAPTADTVFESVGAKFRFGEPSFSISEDFDNFDEMGAFNIDDLDVTELSKDDWKASLQEELAQDFESRRNSPVSMAESAVPPAKAEIAKAGLHAEDAFDFSSAFVERDGKLSFFVPHYLDSVDFVDIEDKGELRGYELKVYGQGSRKYSSFITARSANPLDLDQAKRYVERQVAGYHLQASGHDIANGYSKSAILKVASAWRSIAKTDGALKLPKTSKAEGFEKVARDMGAFKNYKVSTEMMDDDGNGRVTFTDRKTGIVYHADVTIWGDDIQCCTMGLNGGGGLGTEFYAVQAVVARNAGRRFVADYLLSGINSYRRTEQAFSYAIKTGDTGVILPGGSNRVYGYNETPETKEDHDRNTARLALAGLRNVEELFPGVSDLSYDPATDTFADANGDNAEQTVADALDNSEARAFGLGRSAIARAVITKGILDGSVKAAELTEFSKPVAYSMADVGLDEPLGESWGDPDAGVEGLNPNLRSFMEGSKVVDDSGMPLVMYHGTGADIEQFQPSARFGDAYFFSADASYANTMANSLQNWRTGNVMPVFLSIKNPRVISMEEYNEDQIFSAMSSDADGLIATGDDGKMEVVIAFRPEQIKSVFNRGTFDPADPRISYSKADVSPLGYYSALTRSIEAGKTSAAPAAGWKELIKGMVNKGQAKADEVEWSGVTDWLDTQKGRVTRDQVVDYLRGNGVQVEEVVLGQPSDADIQMLLNDEAGEGMTREEAIEYLNSDEGSTPTKYGGYTLPGGENYREVLLTLPVGPIGADADRYRQLNEMIDAKTSPQSGYGDLPDDERRAIRVEVKPLRDERNAIEKRIASYRSSHWDQPNILAHIRVNDRTDADGKRVLFVEELQSDWGQDGKKKGFARNLSTAEKARIDELRKAGKNLLDGWGGMGKLIIASKDNDAAIADRAKLQAFRDEIASIEERAGITPVAGNRGSTAVPAAPYVTKTEGWLNLALKRVIAMAVQGGYDRVAFVTGQQSAERYSLEKQVTKIEYASRESNPLPARALTVYGLRGEEVMSKNATEEELADIIGKEVAERLLQSEPKSLGGRAKFHVVSGLDLKVGGEGMIAFYDKIVPNAVKALVKKLGGGQLAAVEMGEAAKYRAIQADADGGGEVVDDRGQTVAFHDSIAEAREDARQRNGGTLGTARLEQPGFDITPAMREKVGEGLPSFSRANGGFDLPEETRTQKARRKMQDYFLRSRTVQDAIASQGGSVTEKTDFYRAEELSHGRIASLLQDFADKQVRPLMEKAVKFGIELDELSLYAYAMHAKERNAYIATIDKKLQDGGSGMTNAEADSILQLVDLSGDKAKFEELHTDLMTITRGNRMAMLADGLITQEEFNALEGAYDNYVPLRGFEIMDENDKPTGRSPGKGFNIRGAETLKAKGRVSRAGQIIENIISDHQRTIVRGERNHVAKVFLNFALTNPDPDLWEIDATTTRKSIDRKTGRIARNTVIEKGEDTIAVKVKGHEIYIQIKDDLLLRALRKSYTDETGELTSDLMKSVGLYASLLRNTLTRYNPEFAVVNAMRDIGFGAAAALDELGEKGMAKFLAHYAGAMAVSARNESKKLDASRDWDKWFLEYKAAGGTTSGFYAKGLEEISGDIRDMMIEAGAAPKDWTEKMRFNKATRAAKGALRVLEWAGSVSENAARVSAYRTAREMGRTPSQAASIAKNLTTNFDRKGEYGQLLNALYLFYNAAIQGTQRTLKMFKNPKVMGYMAGIAGSAIGLAMASATIGGDDPDDGMAYWDKIPAYVKERNIIIMLPPGAQVEGAEEVGTKGRYLTIPVQYGLNIFHVFGYQIADVIRHQSDPVRGVSFAKAGINIASAVAGSFNPFGGAVDVTNTSSMVQAILPTVFDFPYQLASGTNAFGRDVAPFKSPFDSKPDSQNSNVRQTGSPAEHVAQWMNSVTGGSEYESGAVDISAGTVENFVRNLTGGTGVFIYDVLALGGKWVEHIDGGDPDLYVRDIPIYRRVTGETAGDVDQGLFYERRKAIQEARAIEKGAEEAGGEIKDKEKLALAGMNREASKYTKYLSDVRKEMKALQKDDTLTTAERRLKMRELRAERDRLTAEFNASFTETMREELLSSRDSE